MEFTVPKFIEQEPKIAGPFTFKQLGFVGIPVIISIFLYTSVPLYLFLILAFILVGSGASLAFVKIEGMPLPKVIMNFFTFSSQTKLYLWQKKSFSPTIIKKTKIPKEEEKKETTLKLTEKSRLRELNTFLETKFK